MVEHFHDVCLALGLIYPQHENGNLKLQVSRAWTEGMPAGSPQTGILRGKPPVILQSEGNSSYLGEFAQRLRGRPCLFTDTHFLFLQQPSRQDGLLLGSTFLALTFLVLDN